MNTSHPESVEQIDRLAVLVEQCLDSPSAYRLFAVLTTVSRLGVRVKLEFLDLARSSGGYDDQEMGAIARLTMSGAAESFKEVVDQVRDERVRREIVGMGKDPVKEGNGDPRV